MKTEEANEVWTDLAVLVHLALPFPSNNPTDENKIIKPAFNSSLNALSVVFNAKNTSYYAIIFDFSGYEREPSKTHWSNLNWMNLAYGKSFYCFQSVKKKDRLLIKTQHFLENQLLFKSNKFFWIKVFSVILNEEFSPNSYLIALEEEEGPNDEKYSLAYNTWKKTKLSISLPNSTRLFSIKQ